MMAIECMDYYIPDDSSITIRDIHVNPSILDSGERTEFATGAVRDLHEGKGRMDLLPWRAIIEVSQHCEEGARKYGEHNVDKGIPLHSLIDSASGIWRNTQPGWRTSFI